MIDKFHFYFLFQIKNKNMSVSYGNQDKDSDDLISVCAYPRRLYTIVNNPENHSLINWTESGDHFIIYNPTEFAEKILTQKEFNSANYASFIRQLNNYDFHKVKNRSKDKHDIFYHKYFIKDRPSLLRNIRRKNNSITTGSYGGGALVGTRYSGSVVGDNLSQTITYNNFNNQSFGGYSQQQNNSNKQTEIKEETQDNIIKDSKEDEYGQNTTCLSNIYPFPSFNLKQNVSNNTNHNLPIQQDGKTTNLENNNISTNANSNLNQVKTIAAISKDGNELNQQLINVTNNNINQNKSRNNIPITTSTGNTGYFQNDKKKANKTLIHSLYTSFLKQVSK